MKCPSCGAETKSARFCEYCDSELPKDTPNINITNHYYGNTDNVTGNSKSKNGKGCLWWFLMLCIWPIALSVWFYKTDKVNLDKKWKITIIAVFWVLMLVFGGLSEDTEHPNNDTNNESIVQNGTSKIEQDFVQDEILETEEAVVKDKLAVIDVFIEKYNGIATTPIADVFEIDIHDKEAGYYRTEFRLNAFNDAKAKRGYIGEDMIDIVCTEELLEGINIRIYFNTDNRDAAEDVFNSIALNVYPDLTEADLMEASDEIHERDGMDGRGVLRDINYYYIDSYSELFMDNVMYAE